MAKTRLTASLREEILTKLIAKRFDEEEKALCAEAMEIGPKLYDALMGPWKEKALELPPDFMSQSRTVELDVKVPFFFDYAWGADGAAEFTAVSPVPGYLSGWHRYFMPGPMPKPNKWPIDLGELETLPIWLQIIDLNKRAAALSSRRNSTATTVMNALKGFNTVKALVESWPEVEPFIPGEEAAAQVPALATAELNKLLGL